MDCSSLNFTVPCPILPCGALRFPVSTRLKAFLIAARYFSGTCSLSVGLSSAVCSLVSLRIASRLSTFFLAASAMADSLALMASLAFWVLAMSIMLLPI